MRPHLVERATVWAPLLVLAALSGCGPGGNVRETEEPRFRLTDITEAAGLAQDLKAPSMDQLIEVKGGGVALFDGNGDGHLDIFTPGLGRLDGPREGSPPRLWLGDGAGRFESGGEGLTEPHWGFGVALGDVEGDGLQDIFVACYGRNRLYRSEGDGRFTERAVEAGLAGASDWSTAASFGDLDGDGDLDLYVVNYVAFDLEALPEPTDFRGARVFGGPMGLPGAADQVFENQGDGTFREVTAEWGFEAVTPSYGLGALIADLDHDGRPEVLVGNDSQANFLFQRGEGGGFVDRGPVSGLAVDEHGWGQATMGIALGDVDEDGLADVFSSNFMADHDTLHLNRGELFFEDRSRSFGLALVTHPMLGWGAEFVDLDQDGSQELWVVHGHVYPEKVTAPMGWQHLQPPQLFARTGNRFQILEAPEVAAPFASAAYCDRGLVCGDVDGDGDLDGLVREVSGELRLLRNDSETGAWLGVQLRDGREGAQNPRGLGARLELQRTGQPAQVRWLVSGSSYQSAGPTSAHFGLGDASPPAQLVVHWPDGTRQEVAVSTFEQTLSVEHP